MLKLTMQLLKFGYKFNVELFYQGCTLIIDIWTSLDAGAGTCRFFLFWTPVTQMSFWFVHVAMLVFVGISSKTVSESDNTASISAALSSNTVVYSSLLLAQFEVHYSNYLIFLAVYFRSVFLNSYEWMTRSGVHLLS